MLGYQNFEQKEHLQKKKKNEGWPEDLPALLGMTGNVCAPN